MCVAMSMSVIRRRLFHTEDDEISPELWGGGGDDVLKP